MRLRLTSGPMISKNGFSVVAPISTMVPSSTCGSSASCCALLKRWISSTSRIVRVPFSRSAFASAIVLRMSATPASTALSVAKCDCVELAMMVASVVFPVPGGPHRMMEENSRSLSMARRKRLPGPTIWDCPRYSSSVRARMRVARG